MQLLLDQGLPLSSAKFLRDAEIDAIHVSEIGMSRAKDAEILNFAKQEKRLIITLDSDFHALLALSSANEPSVARVRIEGLTSTSLCPTSQISL